MKVPRVYHFRIKDSVMRKHLIRMSQSVNQVWNYCNALAADSAKAKKQLSADALFYNDKDQLRPSGKNWHIVEADETSAAWSNGFWPSQYDMQVMTKGCSKELGIHADTVQMVCKEIATRRRQFRRSRLRFRKSFGSRRSLGWIPLRAKSLKFDNQGEIIYCGRKFRIWQDRPIRGKALCGGSFAEDKRGRWYVNIPCEIEEEVVCQDGEVGVDLGLKTLAACSDGRKYEAARYFRKLEERFAKAQRRKKKRQVRTLHAKIANARKEYNHKISHELTLRNRIIAVGDASCGSMVKMNMAKSVLDAGWGQLRAFIKYKAITRGAQYLEVDEAFTTQACSDCGAIGGPKGREGLGVREWVCNKCGAHHDRDVNAAKNILRIGLNTLRSTRRSPSLKGEGKRKHGDSDEQGKPQ